LTISQAIIKPATFDDIEAIATVHIQSWKETYPGIMPAQRIAALNLESCMRNWQRSLEAGSRVFVAVVDDTIVGFAAGDKNRSNEHCETGLGDKCDCELAAIYILKEHHHRGIGRALVKRFAQTMKEEGYRSMVIWVAEKNPATGFYAALGGEQVDRKFLMVCEEAIPVVAFQFDVQVME